MMSSPERSSRRRVGGVLCEAVANGPVLGQRLDEIDEDILRANAGIGDELLDDAAIKRPLLRQGPRVVDGQLNDDEIIAARDSEIRGAAAEISRVMLRDHHEEVIRWHIERLVHRLGESVENRLPIGGGLAPAQKDTGERHGVILLGLKDEMSYQR